MFMKILHQVFTARFEICKHRHPVTYFLEIVLGYFNVHTSCHRNKMKHRIRAAAQSHNYYDRIFKSLSCHDVGWTDVFFHQILYCLTRGEALLFFLLAQRRI